MSTAANIPQIPGGLGSEVHRTLTAMKAHIEAGQGLRGGYTNQTVTLGMLVKAGIITQAQAQQMSRG